MCMRCRGCCEHEQSGRPVYSPGQARQGPAAVGAGGHHTGAVLRVRYVCTCSICINVVYVYICRR